MVDKPGQSLLGLSDSLKLNLLTLSPEVHELQAEAPEICTYADLFDGKLGKLPVKHKMTIDSNTIPVVRSAQKIPVAMKMNVKDELDLMERDGIISQVTEPTDWVSNLVAAKKKDKHEIRICLNPHDLNLVLKRSHHPLKTVEDVRHIRCQSFHNFRCEKWILANTPRGGIIKAHNFYDTFWSVQV